MPSQDQEGEAMKPQGDQCKDKALLVWGGGGRWPAVKGVYPLNLEGKKGSIIEDPVVLKLIPGYIQYRKLGNIP